MAAYGPQAGREATVDALGWAWTNWERLAPMTNPTGYLYRVGQTSAADARRPLPGPPLGTSGPSAQTANDPSTTLDPTTSS